MTTSMTIYNVYGGGGWRNVTSLSKQQIITYKLRIVYNFMASQISLVKQIGTLTSGKFQPE